MFGWTPVDDKFWFTDDPPEQKTRLGDPEPAGGAKIAARLGEKAIGRLECDGAGRATFRAGECDDLLEIVGSSPSRDGLAIAFRADVAGTDESAPASLTLTPAMIDLLLVEREKRSRPCDLALAPADPPFADGDLPGVAPNRRLDAGERGTIRLVVENRGAGTAFKPVLKAAAADPTVEVSPAPALEDLPPGGRCEVEVEVSAALEIGDGTAAVTFRVDEKRGYGAPPLRLALETVRLHRPALSLEGRVEVRDGREGLAGGNGNGVAESGETVEVLLPLENRGTGAAPVTVAIEGLPPEVGVLGEFPIAVPLLSPGEREVLRFGISLPRTFRGPALGFRARAADARGLSSAEREVALPFREAVPKLVLARTAIETGGAAVRRLPRGGMFDLVTRPPEVLLGTIPPGAAAPPQRFRFALRTGAALGPLAPALEARERDFPGFSEPLAGFEVIEPEAVDVAVAGEGRAAGPGALAPPAIAVARPRSGDRTSEEAVRLEASITAPGGVRAVRVLVNDRPVPALSGEARGPAGVVPEARSDGRAEPEKRWLALGVPLSPGENRIVIEAEGARGALSTETIVVRRTEERGTVHAAVIGVSDYANVQGLKFARADAQAFRDYLISDLGVPAAQVRMLLDREATLVNRRLLLGRDLPRAAARQDTVIIFFAGHGGQEPDPASPDGLARYLYPADVRERELVATALPVAELATHFGRLAAERVVFLADCCYSGSVRSGANLAMRAGGGGAFLSALGRGQGRVVVTACQPNEVAQEKDDLHHGLFTHFLLEGLRGARADLDGNGLVETDEIFSYVSRAVSRASGETQHPLKEGSGQVILGGAKRK